MLRSTELAPKGFRMDYSDFQSGNLVVETLNGGSLDYGSVSEIPPVFAAASTIQGFRQIAVLHGDVNNQVVLVPKDRGWRRWRTSRASGSATSALPPRITS